MFHNITPHRIFSEEGWWILQPEHRPTRTRTPWSCPDLSFCKTATFMSSTLASYPQSRRRHSAGTRRFPSMWRQSPLRRIGCIQCIRVWAFNKKPGKINDLSRFLIRKTALFNRVFVSLDKLLGYERTFPVERFWEAD